MTELNTAPDPQDEQDEKLAFQVQHLSVAIERILRENPLGISELHLIKALQRPPWELIGPVSYGQPDKLYPVHFLIFHVLYRLRDQLAGAGDALNISPLLIRLTRQDVVGGTGPVGVPDKLRAFYLDLSRYQMPEDSILKMMDDFWSGRHGQQPARDDVLDAAGVFGFAGMPTSFEDVKYRFRRAVMQAHPDRGGETEAIQNLNNAFSVLKAHFQDQDSL
jgi:hypothetical protein